MKRFLLFLAASLLPLAPPTSRAIVDNDNNGVSDVFELQFNNGQSLDPNADPDGDGWTNAQEAAAGTDPFKPNPPDGILRPDIAQIPAVWGTGNNGDPILITPNALKVSWPTIAGKKYNLLYSPDLDATSWMPVGDPFIGTGNITEFNFPIASATKTFWKVQIEDTDSDGDGVSDAEEIALGLDPNNPHSLPGFPDFWLAKNFPTALLQNGLPAVDPNGDPDHDGCTNSDEFNDGTDPNDPESYGPGTPMLVGDQLVAYNSRWGFPGFQTLGHHYLRRVWQTTSTDTDDDNDGGATTVNETIEDVRTGVITNTITGSSAVDYGGEWVVTNDTYRLRNGIDDEGDEGTETSTVSETLSGEYTIADFVANVESWIPAYSGNYSSNATTAEIRLTPDATDPDPACDYLIIKLRYKWRIHARPGQVVSWLEMFTPADGSPPVAESKSWTAGATDTESPVYEIDPTTRNGKKNGRYSVVSVEVAVDANRDGNITFDGNDRTTAGKPFRFWINNDQDDVEKDEAIYVTTPDSESETIATERDLEDFCKLKVFIDVPGQMLRNGDYKIGLKFRNITSGAPGIRIWPNAVADNGRGKYLTDAVIAGSQIWYDHLQADLDNCFLIPPSYWDNQDDSAAHLIFEGVSKGTGELVVVIHDSNGNALAESSGTWIKLLDVREMYRRARIQNEPEEIEDPWVNANPPVQTWTWDDWNWSYDEDPEVEPVTAVMVHGWRMKYMDFMNWSDTAYKRLWHQGFRGKFYSFRWPTFSGDNNGVPYGVDEELEHTQFPPGGTTYNASEYRAWLCGPMLADFVNQLPNPENRKLFAHSMGDVVTGSALRAGMSITRYAMCNAAMSAMAYDSNDSLVPPDLVNVSTPDTDGDATIRSAFGLKNKLNIPPVLGGFKMPFIINFGLPDDEALGSWSANNIYFKPDGLKNYYYDEFPQPMTSHKLFYNSPVTPQTFREITSVPEAMAYVTKSRTRAAGAMLSTGGSVKDLVDMSPWFDKTHSAEWRWNMVSTHAFWEKLAEKLELKTTNP